MFLLGVRNEEKGFINPLHSPKFDFDPNTLRYGFEVFKNILEKMNVI
jgi:metal-dependent amidase/aminoacylase/carboxypeptidase family protein